MGPQVDGGHHQDGGVAIERAIEGQDDVGAVRDGARCICHLGPGARGQPCFLELVGQLTEAGTPERCFAHLRGQACLQAVPGEEVVEGGVASSQQWAQSTG